MSGWGALGLDHRVVYADESVILLCARLPARVVDRIDRSGDCWEWTGYRDRGGYGKVMVDRRKSLAHRVVYAAVHGEIPSEMCVCHRCDNPACCNPAHLFLGSHTDNMRDMGRKGRNAQPRGERSAHAKLTAADVLAIREMHASGSAMRALARTFGVSYPSIAAVVKRKTWRHVA